MQKYTITEAIINEYDPNQHWDIQSEKFFPGVNPKNTHGAKKRLDAIAGKNLASNTNLKANTTTRPDLDLILTDKKQKNVSWRELAKFATDAQKLFRKASGSQDFANISFPNATKPIAFVNISDWHWGSLGTDHDLIVQFTDEIKSIPDLYVGILGDMEQMAIKLRSVQEVCDNVLPPDIQADFTESWLEEMEDRILFVTWENHSAEREEKTTGRSVYKRIMNKKLIYHSHIAHVNIQVGDEVYNIAVSHKFRGNSMYNPVHAQARYMRFEGIDREITIAGDSHTYGIMQYNDGAKERLAINSGSTQINSGYGKRYFSLFTIPFFPVVVLFPDTHKFMCYKNVQDYLDSKK